MRYLKTFQIGFLFLCLGAFHVSSAQETKFTSIPLTDMQAFDKPGENWMLTSNFFSDYSEPWNTRKLDQGTGVIINNLSKNHSSHLITNEEFGDIDLELDFMMDKDSNSGVYIQGRYEVQLADSWRNPDPTFADCGGIYQRWNDSLDIKGFEGMAPLSNVSRAPGLWQHLRIRFRAPRFDANGNKTSNAQFDEVYLNGVLVQQQVEVTGPTRASIFNDEKASGPLVFQGDHGKVAFKNIQHHPLSQLTESNGRQGIGAIVVKPDDRPYLLRSFMMLGDKKLDYVVSVGDHQGLNYSYDLRQGAWFQVWRGEFIDATEMWHNRGEDQLARPLGSVIPFNDSPAIAELPNMNAKWPDSVTFDNLKSESYLLDKKGVPTFKYTINGIKISDEISPSTDNSGLTRTLSAENPNENLYCRLASADTIEQVKTGLYCINGSYYIQLDTALNPLIRSQGQQQEMLISLKKLNSPLIYSLIW